MAKAALEMAVLDAELRAAGVSFGALPRRGRATGCPAASRVGIIASIPELLDAVAGYLDEGYLRIKLKIEPGWDVEPVRAVRERFGDDVLLQVDANTAYTARRRAAPRPARRLRPAADRAAAAPRTTSLGHAELARLIRTPICLDESIVSARAAADAIALGACSIVNIKPGPGRRLPRGPPDPRRVRARTASRCGAAACSRPGSAGPPTSRWPRCPGFTLPGDTSASRRYYRTDITEPFELADGHLAVPTGPGLGREPLPDVLAEFTTSVEEWTG